jgi:hypothetical protein
VSEEDSVSVDWVFVPLAWMVNVIEFVERYEEEIDNVKAPVIFEPAAMVPAPAVVWFAPPEKVTAPDGVDEIVSVAPCSEAVSEALPTFCNS